MPLRTLANTPDVVDLDAVAAHVALAPQVGQQAAVAAAQVEHARALGHPARDRRVVGALRLDSSRCLDAGA